MAPSHLEKLFAFSPLQRQVYILASLWLEVSNLNPWSEDPFEHLLASCSSSSMVSVYLWAVIFDLTSRLGAYVVLYLLAMYVMTSRQGRNKSRGNAVFFVAVNVMFCLTTLHVGG